MSNLTVNTITPHTSPNIDIGGVTPPTYLTEPLALSSEVIQKAGDTMDGPLVLSYDTIPVGPGHDRYAATKLDLDGLSTTILATVASNINNLGSPKVLSGNGYWTGPGGIIIQWASSGFSTDVGSGTPGYNNSVFWPIAFPNACLKCIAGMRVVAGMPNNVAVAVTDYTTTQGFFQIMEWSGLINTIIVDFIAIGH